MPSATVPLSTVLPQGDPTRQALASLCGYAWQLYASSLAWLRLPPDAKLYLEVAEDYAQVLHDSLQAVQAKNTATPITINSPDVLTAIDAYVDLVQRNPQHQVSLLFLTTASLGFIAQRDDERLRRDLLTRIVWQVEQPDLASLRAELDAQMITYGHCRGWFLLGCIIMHGWMMGRAGGSWVGSWK